MYDDIQSFYEKYKKWLVCIVGATATWKSSYSIDLVRKWIDAEIISSDSRQIYKYMNIWTDKVSDNIMKEIKHHQIDIITPDQPYTAGNWKEDTSNIINNIHKESKKVFIVGWTWLYIDTLYKNYNMPNVSPDMKYRKSLYDMEQKNNWTIHKMLQEIDPEEASKIHPNSLRYIVRALEIYSATWQPKSKICKQQPVKWPIFLILLWREKEDTNRLIDTRIDQMMIGEWLIDEVKWLLDQWYEANLQSMQWIWYKEIIWYINWEYSKDKAIEILKRNTYHYAKRQRTWFRRYINDSKTNPKDNVVYKVLCL